MGIRLFGNSSCDCNRKVYVEQIKQPLPNPNPRNFIIKKILEVNGFNIVLLKYPDCTNFEGEKILVFKEQDQEKILNASYLDPHFCDSKSCISPIARFIPTQEGWKMAKIFCENY